MRFQFSIGALMLITALATPFFVDQVSFLFAFFLVEVVVILVATELLFRNMPEPLLAASEDNCMRIDGSLSERRTDKERRALRKVRTDLLAVFLIVAIMGNCLAAFVHYEVVPFPVALNAIQAFDGDDKVFKQNLRDQRIDDDFAAWSGSKGLTDREAVESRQKLLWQSWPFLIIFGFAWAIGSAIFLKRAYLKILNDFSAGVNVRNQINVNRDINLLQER